MLFKAQSLSKLTYSTSKTVWHPQWQNCHGHTCISYFTLKSLVISCLLCFRSPSFDQNQMISFTCASPFKCSLPHIHTLPVCLQLFISETWLLRFCWLDLCLSDPRWNSVCFILFSACVSSISLNLVACGSGLTLTVEVDLSDVFFCSWTLVKRTVQTWGLLWLVTTWQVRGSHVICCSPAPSFKNIFLPVCYPFLFAAPLPLYSLCLFNKFTKSTPCIPECVSWPHHNKTLQEHHIVQCNTGFHFTLTIG